ncbi:MAG: type II secretion system F family protein [Thiolinea sp.]
MALFEYKAVTPAGAGKDGSMEAVSEVQVIESLHAQGLIPVKVTAARGVASSAADKPKARVGLFSSGKVKQADIIAFTQQLSSMLHAGLPLDRALGIQLEIVENPAVEALIRDIQGQVRSGVHFADALEKSGQFSRFYVNMVRAGEASGSIDDALARLVEYMLRAKELRGTVISALIYPAILFVVAVVSIIALLTFVVPQFSQMFSDMGADLPTITKVVMGAGEGLAEVLVGRIGGFSAPAVGIALSVYQ